MTSENVEEIGQGSTPPSAQAPYGGAHPAVCPVVGLGASAGGLEAFQSFLGAVSPDAGLAYVLVQHLDPNHESMLAELLSRKTPLPVKQITDGMAIEPNNVYLIPPNASLVIEKARLRLTEFTEPRGFRRPIDVFFRSLADDQGPNAACVVLSGTGADGSDGLRAIKDAGGLAIVQNPESAKYDGMPKSAVATGLVDRTLDTQAMPSVLQDYFERAQPGGLNLPDVSDFLQNICVELRNRLGHDFSQYKRSTMLRRIQRRMQVVGATSSESYLKRLHESDIEAELLFRDLLINVTCFFRDTDAFDYVRREVIPAILAEKGAHDTVRVWTAGCSSGEEAYSIAILLAEALALQRIRPNVQVFATDIDEQMLQKARSARYPHAAVKDLPIELLDRYFYAEGEDFVVAQSIRDMVRVSNHNLLKDPPFSRCDLMICRNLLIYLNSPLQQRLMQVFHYALRPDGYLFLGSAENIGGRSDLFDAADSAARVYRRRGLQRFSVPMPLALDLIGATGESDPDRGRRQAKRELDPVTRRVMDRYAPVHVVVNAENQISHASGRTGKYLELASGAPSNNIGDLAKRVLRPAIRSLLETVRKSGRRAVKRDIGLEGDADRITLVDITADPLNDEDVLLIFHDVGETRREADDAGDTDVDHFADEDRMRLLEDELDTTRNRLRTTVEELETSNEELKSSNEEMMSMNEELQSTNEELSTVNEELNNKVDQLARSNSDLENFIASTQVPVIFLDQKLQLRSFTPATRALFRFQEQDKGRAFSDVVSRLNQQDLENISRTVLDKGRPEEMEFDLPNGESYVLRVLPYLDAQGTTTGVVLVFADVTRIRQTQADLKRNIDLAQVRTDEIVRLYETAPVGMALIDRNRRFLKINRHFADLAGRDVDSHIGRSVQDMHPVLAERMEGCISEVFERAREITNIEATIRLTDTPQDFLMDFFPYEEEGVTAAVGVIMKDVTEVRRLERESRRLMDELQHRVKNTLATVLSIVNQTVKTKSDQDDLVDTLKRRIGALAATHDLLTQADWRSVALQAIIEAELRPFDHRERIELRGPPVMLPPKHALTLTLTLHELATNAAKYGALAHPTGKLQIEWSVSVDETGRRLKLLWKETGAPMPKGKVKESFGSKLIRSAVKHDLKGEVDYSLRPDGASCAITFAF